MSSQKKISSLKQDFISRLSTNKQHVIALIILFILPFILYSAIFIGGKQFFGNDVLQWRAGDQSIHQYSQKHGKNPLWATNMFSGMPAYTISQPMAVPNVDTVIKKLSGKDHPVPYFWVLLFGAYLLFVMMGFRPLAAVVGAVCIGFTTYLPIIVEAGHGTKFVAFSYIPWVLVGYWLLSRSKRKWLGVFTFGLALTLELRAFHPQVTYYFIYLLGFWWLFDTVMQYRRNQLKDWGVRTALMVGGGLLAIVCSMENYLTLYQYSQFSTRAGSTLAGSSSGGGLDLQYAFKWSQGFGELLTLIIPGIFGGASGAAYWGPKPFTSGPHYLGAIAFVLALVAIFRSRKNTRYLFLGVGVLTMLFSLGYHFKLLNGFMFRHVPYFNKFRTPEMWLIITVFCFSVLAVYGIQAIIQLVKERSASLKPLYLPLGIALGIGLIFTLANGSLLSFDKPGQRQQILQQAARQNNVSPQNRQLQRRVDQLIETRIKPKRKKMAQADSLRYLILVLLASGLIVAFYKRKIGVGLFLAGLVLLAAYDMLSVGSRYVKDDDLKSGRLNAEQVIQQQQRPIDAFIQKHVQENTPYSYRVFPLLDNPFNNAIPAFFYPSIGGYSGAKLSIYQDLIDHALMKGNSINMAVLDMLNVKYVSYNRPLPFPHLKQVYSQNNRVVMENTDVLPKAFFVDSVKAVSSPQAAVDQLNRASFDPAKQAIVESNQAPATQADTTANVEVASYQDNKIKLTTSRKSPGFMVLSEIYYPAGWKAAIDGKAANIYKTNFVLRGLEIPAGTHTITMKFEPSTVYWGNVLAQIGHALLLCLGVVALVVTYKQRN